MEGYIIGGLVAITAVAVIFTIMAVSDAIDANKRAQEAKEGERVQRQRAERVEGLAQKERDNAVAWMTKATKLSNRLAEIRDIAEEAK